MNIGVLTNCPFHTTLVWYQIFHDPWLDSFWTQPHLSTPYGLLELPYWPVFYSALTSSRSFFKGQIRTSGSIKTSRRETQKREPPLLQLSIPGRKPHRSLCCLTLGGNSSQKWSWEAVFFLFLFWYSTLLKTIWQNVRRQKAWTVRVCVSVCACLSECVRQDSLQVTGQLF